MRSLDNAITALQKLSADLAIIDELSSGAINATIRNRYWSTERGRNKKAESFQQKTYVLREQIKRLVAGLESDHSDVRHACWMAFLNDKGISLDQDSK